MGPSEGVEWAEVRSEGVEVRREGAGVRGGGVEMSDGVKGWGIMGDGVAGAEVGSVKWVEAVRYEEVWRSVAGKMVLDS